MQDSYVSVNKDVILRLCNDVVSTVAKNRQRQNDILIKRKVEDKNKAFFNRVFKKKIYTYEEVKEECDWYSNHTGNAFRDGWDYIFLYPSDCGEKAMEVAYRLKNATTFVEGESMYISSRDLEILEAHSRQ